MEEKPMADKPVIFISKYLGLRVVIVPSRYVLMPDGGRHLSAGKSAQFVNGYFETKDKEIIDFLMNSPRKGIDYVIQEGQEVDATVSAEGKEQLADEAAAVETTAHSCPKCSYKAKNLSGLKAHIRAKHGSEE